MKNSATLRQARAMDSRFRGNDKRGGKKAVWHWVAVALLLLGTPQAAFPDPPQDYNKYEKLNDRGIWDYNFTRARSGLGWEIPDTGSSEGKGNTKNDPRSYFIPTHEQLNRMVDEVERDEVENTAKIRDYSDGALLQVYRPLVASGYSIPSGYYEAWIGDLYSGSEKKHLEYYDQPIPEKVRKQHEDGDFEQPSSLILKRQGKVVAALPINRRFAYERQKGEPKAKQPFALIEESPEGPVILVYYKKWVYAIDVQPATPQVTYPTITRGPLPLDAQAQGQLYQAVPTLQTPGEY